MLSQSLKTQPSEIGVIGAVGPNELQRQVVEAGAGREVRGETIETIL
jgi:hypothetical protein